jgi:hypothetical protein
MNRPDPIHSNAPDDKQSPEKWKFWFTGGNGTVSAWINEESDVDDDGMLTAWRDKECTKECIVNFNFVYYATVDD